MTTINRKLKSVYTPPAQPGFLGKGHVASPVIQVDFSESDPFIMLMDDRLNKTDNTPVGGPHPHAGFETVTLVLKGEIGDDDHGLKEGDFEMMTAGSGVVHTEILSKPAQMRILQLWLNLPKKDRNATPRVQRLKADHVPVISAEGVEVKLYSGTLNEVTSPVKNHTPLIIARINIKSNHAFTANIPADFSTFFYVTDGKVLVGEKKEVVSAEQVGWLERADQAGTSQVEFHAGENGAQLVLYSAQPQHHEIVSHGPFIADSMDDIRQLYTDYRAGKMGHISEVPAEQQMSY